MTPFRILIPLLALAFSALLPVQESKVVTMTEIWQLYAAGESEKLIEAVSPYVSDELTPRDRRAVCLFLKGDALRRCGRWEAADTTLRSAVDFCGHGEAPTIDTPYGKTEIRPLCELSRVLNTAKERGAYPDTSARLTEYAWHFQTRGQNDLAISFAERCIASFSEAGKKQQQAHVRRFGLDIPTLTPASDQEKEMLKDNWALYDVGTCHFIVGLSCDREARAATKRVDALAFAKKGVVAFERVISDYPAAQCFDPSGPWYWRVRDGAEEHLPTLRQLVRSLDT